MDSINSTSSIRAGETEENVQSLFDNMWKLLNDTATRLESTNVTSSNSNCDTDSCSNKNNNNNNNQNDNTNEYVLVKIQQLKNVLTGLVHDNNFSSSKITKEQICEQLSFIDASLIPFVNTTFEDSYYNNDNSSFGTNTSTAVYKNGRSNNNNKHLKHAKDDDDENSVSSFDSRTETETDNFDVADDDEDIHAEDDEEYVTFESDVPRKHTKQYLRIANEILQTEKSYNKYLSLLVSVCTFIIIIIIIIIIFYLFMFILHSDMFLGIYFRYRE